MRLLKTRRWKVLPQERQLAKTHAEQASAAQSSRAGRRGCRHDRIRRLFWDIAPKSNTQSRSHNHPIIRLEPHQSEVQFRRCEDLGDKMLQNGLLAIVSLSKGPNPARSIPRLAIQMERQRDPVPIAREAAPPQRRRRHRQQSKLFRISHDCSSLASLGRWPCFSVPIIKMSCRDL